MRVGSELPDSEVTGWAAVDGQVAQLRRRLAVGRTSEDGQAVGLLCRDIMVTLADACHNPAAHGDVGASAVDRLNAVVDYLAPGEENQRLRKLLKFNWAVRVDQELPGLHSRKPRPGTRRSLVSVNANGPPQDLRCQGGGREG